MTAGAPGSQRERTLAMALLAGGTAAGLAEEREMSAGGQCGQPERAVRMAARPAGPRPGRPRSGG